MEAQLVHIRAPGCWSASVRPGFCQPLRLAHRCRAGCVPPFVRVDPAGVQVAEEESLVIWLALVLVSFSHDQVLDVGQWEILIFTPENLWFP